MPVNYAGTAVEVRSAPDNPAAAVYGTGTIAASGRGYIPITVPDGTNAILYMVKVSDNTEITQGEFDYRKIPALNSTDTSGLEGSLDSLQTSATAIAGYTDTLETSAAALSTAVSDLAAIDPLANEVPGNYEQGTAGYALSRLIVTAEAPPVIVVPAPEASPKVPVWIQTPSGRYDGLKIVMEQEPPVFIGEITETDREFLFTEQNGVGVAWVYPSDLMESEDYSRIFQFRALDSDIAERFEVPAEGGSLIALIEAYQAAHP
jgi:hypothetical protein